MTTTNAVPKGETLRLEDFRWREKGVGKGETCVPISVKDDEMCNLALTVLMTWFSSPIWFLVYYSCMSASGNGGWLNILALITQQQQLRHRIYWLIGNSYIELTAAVVVVVDDDGNDAGNVVCDILQQINPVC